MRSLEILKNLPSLKAYTLPNHPRYQLRYTRK